MRPKTAFLLLAIAGAIIPYLYFVPWVVDHGFNLQLFVDQMLANRVSKFFAADVIVSAIAVVIFLAYERRSLGLR